MNSALFSRNLRQLRIEKKLTQEQLAGILGVSVQSVSRWECGNTLPDVMLLPEIARLYGVTVDDLYREDASGYPSYAQRLLAVYEASGRSEDFLAAEQEFARMTEPTADDLRAWGVLYHYMMKHSAAKAQQKLEQAMAHPEAGERVYRSAALQKNAVLYDLGKGDQEAERYDQLLEQQPENLQLWVLCSAANLLVGRNLRALEVAREGLARFPEQAVLHVHAGDACRELKQYEQAFFHWRKALALDHSFLDAAFSMGFCYEELGQPEKACKVWTELTRELDRRGLTIERNFPAELAENCQKRMGS